MQNNYRSIQSIQNTSLSTLSFSISLGFFWLTYGSYFCLILIFPEEPCRCWLPIWVPIWVPICSITTLSFSLFRRRARISRPLLSTLIIITMIIFVIIHQTPFISSFVDKPARLRFCVCQSQILCSSKSAKITTNTETAMLSIVLENRVNRHSIKAIQHNPGHFYL